MSPSTHQTVRLSAGRHARPEQGVCVMELASMLAGEPFSDHPACACPIIGAFLRTYNDRVDDRHRQGLYPLAALLVGSRGDEEAESTRGDAFASWIQEILADGTRPRWRQWRLARAARAERGSTAEAHAVAAGRLAARLTRQQGDAGHARVVAFLDELLAVAAFSSALGQRREGSWPLGGPSSADATPRGDGAGPACVATTQTMDRSMG